MSPAAAVWLRIAIATMGALGLLLALSPARPPGRLPSLLQPAAGALAGLLLYLLVTRRRPRWKEGPAPRRWPLARWGLLFVLAAGEEIVWRRVALGELLFAGAAAALAASTLVFALAHRARPGLHLLTGATFGGLYLATGALAASIAAHWVYNILVAWRPEHEEAVP